MKKKISPDTVKNQLITFNDASGDAYGSVVYHRQISATGHIKVSFVASKTRVAPMKKHTITQLELLSNGLGADLTILIIDEMKIKFDEIIFFTDNGAVVHWLHQPVTSAILVHI